MKTSKVISALLIAVVICASPCESYGQVLHTVAKVAAKKGAKEATKKSTKTLAKETVQQVSEKAAKKVGTEAAESAAKRTMKTVLKEGVEDFTGITAAKRLEQLVKSRSASSLSRFGSNQSLDLAEQALEKSMKDKAADRISREAGEHAGGKAGSTAAKNVMRNGAKTVGKEALELLKDDPTLTKKILSLEPEKGPLFSIDNLIVTKSGKSTRVEFSGTTSIIEVKEKTIYANAGSTANNGMLNEFLNPPLPNKTYVTDKYSKFVTDAKGRTISSECHSSELNKICGNIETPHTNPARTYRTELPTDNKTKLVKEKGGKQGVHDSGHIQQHSTGGQNESINLLPMKSNLQRGGAWAKLEKMERQAIQEGKDVVSRKTINYHNDGSYDILVELIIDGETTKKDFKNLF